MYRWLLCWRYLRTRYIALASVVSVTLGVATLIIVNSVMDGFTTQMQERMHGILSDIVVESHASSGLQGHEEVQKRIHALVGDQLAGMTTVVHVPAMINIDHQGEQITRQINLIGIDTETYAKVSDFRKYLLHPENRENISFDLHESGYAPDRDSFPASGWEFRRVKAKQQKRIREITERNERLQASIDASMQQQQQMGLAPPPMANQSEPSNTPATQATQENEENKLAFPPSPYESSPDATSASSIAAANSSRPSDGAPAYDQVISREEEAASIFDPEESQHTGIVLGISIASTRYRMDGEVVDHYFARPGDDVQITFPSAGSRPDALFESFTVVDFYESQMSEYDSSFAFVPLQRLQAARGMRDGISSIQLKLVPGADLDSVRDTLRRAFPARETGLSINTWRDLQGPLLAAVQMETTILNILLFLIIAVAGFGILATFFMIVVEKTKDIGILKSLGASGQGVASVFVGYGVLLGTFGAGVGAVAGLIFVAKINEVADLLEYFTGQEVFDPTVYYFDSIPTIVHPAMVIWVMIGAVGIAVLASVLPSIRAARMHPVRALRYE